MRYGGLYHVFYQYNPRGATWGNIVWAHSVSKDLVNWTPLDPALFPSQPSDINGCWSGSATLLPGNKPAILYTGIDSRNRQVQNLAQPKNLSDPFLREWVKSPKNPLMEPTSANNIDSSSFRDPTTAWLGKDGQWRVLVGSLRETSGTALLYKSKDFVDWVQAEQPLHSTLGSGMWECPDFFPVLNYDYGKYYASKTFFDDGKKRRILLAWVSESSSSADDKKKGWSGIYTIPRTIWLHKSGKQLVQWPVVEIEKLRAYPVNLPPQVLKGGQLLHINGVTATQRDCKSTHQFPSEYSDTNTNIWSSLNKDNDLATYGTFVDVDPLHEKLSLRTLIDHSVVESFGGEGRACITARVYPTLAINDKAQIYAFNNGTVDVKITKLNAWSMKKAQINRN
ncbi:Beta-fructofuranosidase, cell wall isozyme [Glycine soja]|uniref:Beta-fructofuranosidase, cell wall isozyme n=1 Tax=Glycine soja TaxID=3848 RepID=A0A445JH18_GLYSO|nr:Beta-fructofuranosidase, cell wall isozyme [Glycine soja]